MATSVIKDSNKRWRLLGFYSITTTLQTIDIPENCKEIYCIVGQNNNNTQVYGGKSYIFPESDEHNIITTDRLINGSGIVVSEKGVYLLWNSNGVQVRAFDIISGKSLLLRIYYR